MPYGCDTEDGNGALVLVTMLETGDVQAMCGDCFPAFIVAAYRGMYPEPEVTKPAPKARRPRKGTTAAAGAVTGPTDPGTDAETDEATDDDGAQDHTTIPPGDPIPFELTEAAAGGS